MEKYVINYNCQPEIVFFMIRNTIKPLYELPQPEYANYINQFMSTLDTYQNINKDHFNSEFDSLYFEKEPLFADIYKNIWGFISPELYFIFSSLQLKDIYVPANRYESEIERNSKEKERLLTENKNASESQISKNKKEIEKINTNIENLNKELRELKKNNECVVAFINNKKHSLLNEVVKQNKREISKYFIQYCLYPRILFSKVEALFAAKMLILLINSRIQNINVFDIMQKMIKFLLPCILSVTEFEAHKYRNIFP